MQYIFSSFFQLIVMCIQILMFYRESCISTQITHYKLGLEVLIVPEHGQRDDLAP